MRGDHGSPSPCRVASSGPSPHARGPPADRGGSGDPRRTTPACAGTTVVPAGTGAHLQDHPRMRGDHCRTGRNRRSSPGPPPHARGPPPTTPEDDDVPRTTPACAGTTLPDLHSYERVTKFCFTPHAPLTDHRVTPSRTPTHPPPHIHPRPQLTVGALPLAVPHHHSTPPTQPRRAQPQGDQQPRRRERATPREDRSRTGSRTRQVRHVTNSATPPVGQHATSTHPTDSGPPQAGNPSAHDTRGQVSTDLPAHPVPSSRSANWRDVRECHRAAASSVASGRPSRRRQISAQAWARGGRSRRWGERPRVEGGSVARMLSLTSRRLGRRCSFGGDGSALVLAGRGGALGESRWATQFG